MGWARFDDCYPDHPKIVAAGFEAECLDMRAIMYCCRYETDGHVSKHLLQRIGSGIPKPAVRAAKLVEVGRWTVTENGWEIVDFLRYNPSRADREAERAAARGRMTKAREAKRSGEVRANTRRSSDDVRVTPSRPLIEQSSRDSLTRSYPQAVDDEGRMKEVIDRIVRSKSEGARDPVRYAEKVRANLQVDHDRLRRIIRLHPEAPIEMLASAALGEPTPYLGQYRTPDAELSEENPERVLHEIQRGTTVLPGTTPDEQGQPSV